MRQDFLQWVLHSYLMMKMRMGCPFTDKTLLSSFKLPIFASITVFLFFPFVNQPVKIFNLRRKFELLLLSTLFIGGRETLVI